MICENYIINAIYMHFKTKAVENQGEGASD